MKKFFCGLIVLMSLSVLGMKSDSESRGVFFYRVPDKLYDLHNSVETDPKYDNNSSWLELKSKKDDECENFIEQEDLSEDDIEKLESAETYEEKAEAFEKAFFGNKFLYKNFRGLIGGDSKNIEELASMHSEFFRWIISNQRGNYEKAKSLVGLYKSLNNYSMYLLWKCIATFLNLPVERM